MTKSDQISLPGLAKELINELENDSSRLSKNLDKTDFLGRSPKPNSPYKSLKMNRNKSMTCRLRKLIFSCIIGKPNAHIFLTAYNQKFPDDMIEELKPGKNFEKTINGMILPDEKRVPLMEKPIIVRFTRELEAFHSNTKKEYLGHSEDSINLSEMQPFRELRLSPNEENILKNAHRRKVTLRIMKNMSNRIGISPVTTMSNKIHGNRMQFSFGINPVIIEKELNSNSINTFLGESSSQLLFESTDISLERCEELIKIISIIKDKRKLSHEKLKYDFKTRYANGKSFWRALSKHPKKKSNLENKAFGWYIAQKLNKTWYAVKRYSKEKNKKIRFSIAEVDGNGRGWERITAAKIIVELGRERFEKVLSKQGGGILEDFFATHDEAELAWSRFETNFTPIDIQNSKFSNRKLYWNTDRRLKGKKRFHNRNHKKIHKLIKTYEFNQPQALRKIKSAILLCDTSFGGLGGHSYLGPNTDLNQIANEMLFLYLRSKQYRTVDLEKSIDEINKMLSF
tara:strand:- start:479 stop:2014 length:1536 start_codon:yes stop_codon:yes gene_type:complete